jgi:hypothetical protein
VAFSVGIVQSEEGSLLVLAEAFYVFDDDTFHSLKTGSIPRDLEDWSL